MGNTLTLTEFVRKLAELGKLVSLDIIDIERFYNNNSNTYIINIIPGYLKIFTNRRILQSNTLSIIVDKVTGMVIGTHDLGSSKMPDELKSYISQVKTTGTIIVDDMVEFVPTRYNDKINKYTIIEYIRKDRDEEIRIFNPARANSAAEVIKVEKYMPFETLIFSKPMSNAVACKKIARRLVNDGFEYITAKTAFMIENHVIDRYYRYRDIHICFYRDSVIYVGLASTNQFPEEWESFTNITENILDTEIHQYLVENWYNPNN